MATSETPTTGKARTLLEKVFEGWNLAIVPEIAAQDKLREEVVAARVFARRGLELPQDWSEEADDPRREAYNSERAARLRDELQALERAWEGVRKECWETGPIPPERLKSFRFILNDLIKSANKAWSLSGDLL